VPPTRKCSAAAAAALLAAAVLVAPSAAAAADAPPIARGAPGLGAVAAAAAPRGAERTPAADEYIVQLDAPPLARYQGGAKGFAATSPAVTGAKVDTHSGAARAWSRELDHRQAAVLAATPGVTPTVRYRTALAGFAARLSAGEARTLRAQPGVAHVTKERFLRLSDSGVSAPLAVPAAEDALAGSEAALMGLPGGLWQTLGGPAQAGRGVIVGVVDSGITPESASFADRGLPAPALWDGACQAGEQFPSSMCDNKLIGARYFVEGFGRDNLQVGDYLSPRDEVGHGTHVASIAVGDDGVDPLVDDNPLGVDRITGVAPGAYLAVYKACWEFGACSDVDVVAAIDAAVADGVDVINLSLGGPQDPSQRVDPVEQATLAADEAGVFVAVSAGNDGDRPSATGSPASAPWTTAVAATTGSRTFRSTLHVSGGGGSADVPASTTWQGFADATLLDARSLDPDHPGSAFDDPRYCAIGLTREQVGGKVVLCDAFAPVELVAYTLSQAGAAGFVLIGGEQIDDPVVHSNMPVAVVERSGGEALRAVTAGNGGVATLQAPAATATPWTPDRVAGFSSRGPGAMSEDLQRPDVSAPGVNVLAAYAPGSFAATQGSESATPFAVLSGTSMASPQAAGAGALLTQVHPAWLPAQMRSALATTARPVTDGDGPASALAAGSGRIDPTAAAGAGLVIAPSAADYRAFAAGTIAGRDLNLPSIQIGELEGQATVTRTVTSVASTRASWTATVQGARLFELEARVTPQRFTIAPGQSRALTIDVSDTEGAIAARGLTIVLHNGQDGRTLSIPVTLRNPGIKDAPAVIDVPADAGDGSQPVTATVNGTVHPTAFGLAAPEVRTGLATQANEFPDVQEFTLPVTLTRATQLFAAKVTSHDEAAPRLLTRIYRDVDGDGRWTPIDQGDDVSLPQDFEGAIDEADAARLPAGKYLVQVNAIDPHDSPIPFDLRTWQVDDPQPDDPQPAPGIVAGGDVDFVSPLQERTFDLRYSGVTGSESLRGLVEWNGAGDANVLARSVVRVTPGQPAASGGG
jgi:subtilisin family serine protease